MASKKFYAVRVGRKPGIYSTWAACQQQINGYSGAQYKSFPTRAEAEAFVNGKSSATPKAPRTKNAKASAPMANADITVYTDGGNRNTGNVQGGQVKATDKSAWAYEIVMPDETLTGTSGEWGATNNRMEIMALIQALDQLTLLDQTESSILVVSDSKYVLDAIMKGWLTGWKRRGWKRSNGELVNAELWKIIDKQLANFTHLQFHWVKGHANTSGNVTVDELLNQTMDQMRPNQPIPEHHGTKVGAKGHVKSAQTTAAPVKIERAATAKPARTTPAPQSTTAPTDDKFGHLSRADEKANSVSAMEDIVNSWKQNR
ncbi:ribonuclease H family protein [Lactiplantibacillus fabifermentans]|nr:ribonuclease H family protein [Lactiplantibacillus fabifermentans]ETY74464.1 ribonuclease [Lactiplantibacillus fabifermentans T30PCM01]